MARATRSHSTQSSVRRSGLRIDECVSPAELGSSVTAIRIGRGQTDRGPSFWSSAELESA